MKFKSAGIVGIGTYVPERVMSNFDFEKIIDTTDEWIRTRTGVSERRYAAPDQATSDLCVEAAKKVLASTGKKIEEIDMILVATCSPDFLLPSTACLVQEKLGAVCGALDINAACSGFVYGLTLANSLVISETYKNVLVIGAETLSRMINMEDRNTCILFGDGAAAAIVSEVEEGHGILSTYLGSQGDTEGVLTMKSSGSRYPVTEETVSKGENFVSMKGQEVFKFAVGAFPNSTEIALKKANIEPSEVDVFIPHQANLRIIETASKKLGIPLEKFYINLQKYGNTSAASIGLALGEALENNFIKKDDIVVVTGFGGGLTFGSLIMKWAY